MYTQWTDSAGRARNILDAWQRKDLDGLRAELNLPHNPSGDSEEQERMDLLHAITQQMQQDLSGLSIAGNQVCFRLLKHLALSGSHPAIRPRKLALFPC
jgi:hypothetical protein